MLEMFAQGFAALLSVKMLAPLALGVIIGIIVGASPGLSSSMGLILVLPATYGMSLESAMAIFLGIYVGSVSGGLITAILLNIPGTSASVPTTFDGAPMAKKGQAGKALSVGIVCSFFGGMFSFIFLFFLSPTIAVLALKFSAVEYFAVSFFALMLVASLAGKSLVKGLASAAVGMAFATVGMAPLDAARRYTFGYISLDKGFAFIAVLIGFYAVIEVLKMAELFDIQPSPKANYRMKGFDITRTEVKENLGNFFISSTIGTGIGFLPGIGSGTAAMISYTVTKNRSKTPELFGTGIVPGVVASESANNAVIGGALIPLLTLGIPGDGSTAILLSAFMMHGITPGPLLFTTQGSLIYTMFACLFVANIMMVIMEYYSLPLVLKVLNLPREVLFPVIMVLCSIGAYGSNNRTFDIVSILVFAALGYTFHKFKFPAPPFIMGFILCPIVEKYLLRALQLTGGSIVPFFTRPISGFFMLLSVVFLAMTVHKQSRYNA
ncbi:Tat pathway signal protein [Clostridium sp. MCC353]|uniref:tripartite tricarboxylate transporter permease n=1 Tax=Clostridium sp. MCC353 TaxID=2592646 RepID=UPI001C02A1B8|nr:tripartite tricarboxylate transporter permease [Clostridium sp. MCC353]MBT9775558.1 Tat pathway signal protein [Clostridium sp. MCC353]